MRPFLSLFLIICSSPLFGLNLYLDAIQYLDEELKPYIEVQYKIPSESIEFTKNDNGKLQGAVKINLVVKQAGKILLKEEYPLFTQELDELNYRFDLIDFKKIPVENGVIEIKLSAMDYLNGLRAERSKSFLFKLPYLSSDLCLLDNYYFLEKKNEKSHGNIFTVPRVSTYYNELLDTFIVYFETYSKAGQYDLMVFNEEKTLTYLVEVEHANGKLKQQLVKLPKLKLGSGKLNIVLSNKSGDPIKSIEIHVPKPKDEERFMALTTFELKRYFRWIEPTAHINEFENLNDLLKDADSSLVKLEFMAFWKKRNDEFPWEAWLAYQNEVALVNKAYGMPNTPGFMTDRGRVYLQYGPPGNVTEMKNPETYPYEIWQYFDDGKMGDSRFYFVNYSFTKNNFTLVHSTALGEPQNPSWKQTIQRGNQRGHNKNGIGTGWENEFINE